VSAAIRPVAWVLVAGFVAGACASSGGRRPGSEAQDRTADPELEAAREAARPDFETQADALAAGVYEPFVHPDSVSPAPTAEPLEGGLPEGPDPSTEELLGTLGQEGPYNAVEAPRGEPDQAPALDIPAARGEWTLQLGAFESETGALVRIRQIAHDFPRLPRWYEREGGHVRVFVGRFAERAEAERERARVADAGYPDAWVTQVP
jgi:cell division septation protein DedD